MIQRLGTFPIEEYPDLFLYLNGEGVVDTWFYHASWRRYDDHVYVRLTLSREGLSDPLRQVVVHNITMGRAEIYEVLPYGGVIEFVAYHGNELLIYPVN